MNSIHTNSIANNANFNTGLNANTNINNRIVKENTSMNTNTVVNTNTIARRFAALLAFGGLLAFSHSAVKADVVVDKFVGPQQTYGVMPGTTALQLKVRNTDGYTVSGVNIKTALYKMEGLFPVLQASPASGAFSLGPYQSEWITIAIPAKSSTADNPLLGQTSQFALRGSGKPSPTHFQQLSSTFPQQANVQPMQCTFR